MHHPKNSFFHRIRRKKSRPCWLLFLFPFGAVFLIGAEDGIFPSYKSIASAADTEEERRLMYVAITRAKKNLFIVLTRQRMLFGQTQCLPPSRFLREISASLLS